MNAFVRDGAVNRKRRARLSLTTRNTEPQRKKIQKTDDDGATTAPRDLASNTLQIHSGECSVNQSTVITTEKESRYTNVEYMRARAFLYLNYKKISSSDVNQLLKEYLKKFDGNESHLKRIFDQCYDLTGSVEKSKDMMKQLETNINIRLDLTTRKSSISPRIVDKKTFKVIKKKKHKKSMTIRLKEKIDENNLILFGMEYSSKDKKILYTNKPNDYNITPKIDYDSDTTIISDDEEIGSWIRMTKAYSLHDSFRVTNLTKPKTGVIIRIKSNLCKNNPQSNTFCAKKTISTTTQLKTSVHKKLKKGLNVSGTVNSQISSSNKHNFEELTNPQLNTDASVQNAEGFGLETVNDVEQIIVPQFKIDGIVKNSNVLALKRTIEEGNTVPQLKMDECIQNSGGSALVQNIKDGEMTVSPLIIDELVQDANITALEMNIHVEKTIDIEFKKSTTTQYLVNAQINSRKIDTDIDNSIKQSETNTDVEEIMVPKLIIDEFVQNSYSTKLETNTVEENTVLQLKMDECAQNSEGLVLVHNIDDEEMTVPSLIIDEFVQDVNTTDSETNILVEKIIDQELEKSTSTQDLVSSQTNTLKIDTNIVDSIKQSETTALDADIGELMVPPLIIDESVQNDNSTTLQPNILVGKIIDQELEKSSSIHDLVDSPTNVLKIDTNFDDSIKQSETTALDADIGELMVPPLIIDESVKNNDSTTLQPNILVGKFIDQELEKSISTQDLVDSPTTVLKVNTNIDDSINQLEILDHANIELKIRKMIDTDDKVFKNSIIKDLATYFLNDDFLYKVDALWKTTESDLVGELVIKLLNMFNDAECNMAKFTGCLICIFREIAQKSSILPCQLKLKLIVFLDAIKKYIKFHDNALWRTWFLPSMFFDWCFIVAFIFMNTQQEFKIDLNKSVIGNATAYFKMVKRCRYIFINQESKPRNSHKKNGIFELTRIDDLLEIDDVHAINDTKVVPNKMKRKGMNIPSNELERKKLITDNLMDTVNHTTPGNIEDVCPAPVHSKLPKITIHPQFNILNSFNNKLKWFNGDVNELMKKFNVSTSNERIESFIVQNNTTVTGNNIQPSSVNKRQSTKNKPTKSKKSKTQVESPRVFFTIANNPKEFDITYGSSAMTRKSSSSVVSNNVSSSSIVPKNSSSSAVSNNVSSSSTVLKNSSSSAAVTQSSSSSTVSQNVSPYYNSFSSSNMSCQFPVTLPTVVSRSLSSYYHNICSNITQNRIGLQTRPSISNTTQSSNAISTNPPVDKNTISIAQPFHSSNHQRAIHHQHSTTTNSQLPKAANTWPSNIYNMCNDFCSKSNTCDTHYSNAVPLYSQSPYDYNITSATSHPQHSIARTYSTTYTRPVISDLLASNIAGAVSMNTYVQQQNYNYRHSYSRQNDLQPPDHNTQVSPDLPDALSPNMPNQHDAVKTCMAANCTNTSSFPCNTCLATFYCSIQCQKSDWHYHQNECCVSF